MTTQTVLTVPQIEAIFTKAVLQAHASSTDHIVEFFKMIRAACTVFGSKNDTGHYTIAFKYKGDWLYIAPDGYCYTEEE